MKIDKQHSNYPVLRIELRPSDMLVGEIGLFAVRKINQGDCIVPGEYFQDENFMSWREWESVDPLTRSKLYGFCTGTVKGINVPKDLNYVPAPWYINHSCDPNAGFNEEGDLIAIRNISVNTEITWDYTSLEYNTNFTMVCQCGSDLCRGIITANLQS